MNPAHANHRWSPEDFPQYPVRQPAPFLAVPVGASQAAPMPIQLAELYALALQQAQATHQPALLQRLRPHWN
jgi:hypothetical protein